MPKLRQICFFALVSRIGVAPAMNARRAERRLERDFTATVKPFVETYCVTVHRENRRPRS